MPSYDYRCLECSAEFERFTTIALRNEQTCVCGGSVERVYKAHAVIGDDIPGGMLIEHGICHPDGTPKRYDTKSSIQKALDKAGWMDAREAKGVRVSDYRPKLSGEKLRDIISREVQRQRSKYEPA